MAAGAVFKGAAVFETEVTSMFMSSSTLSDLSALVESSSATAAAAAARPNESIAAVTGTLSLRRRGPARSSDCDISSVIGLSLALPVHRHVAPFHELAERGIENSKQAPWSGALWAQIRP